MQWQNLLLAFLLPWLGVALAGAAPLSSARVTETRNEVEYKGASAAERAAVINDVVSGADVLRTGERSLAELAFDDNTITRLGSKSVFSFQADTREFHVDQGLALICMPKGAGGGHIVTSAITAAIEGTTVLALGSGKIIFLEGFGIITTADGRQSQPIHGGQIAFLDKGVLKISDILLDPLLNSWIIKSRAQQLPTWIAIQNVNQQQKKDISSGKLVASSQGGQPGTPPNTGDPAYRSEGIIGTLLGPTRPSSAPTFPPIGGPGG